MEGFTPDLNESGSVRAAAHLRTISAYNGEPASAQGSCEGRCNADNRNKESPGTPGLEQLNLARLRDPVHSYRNLFYHRTVIAEGIRQVAFRNMGHLSDAMARPPALNSLAGDDEIAEVQRRMLQDQGMDDAPLNRTLIGWATYYPLQVYLALLYAEVEFYQDHCRGEILLDDSGFSAYLDSREQFVETLRGFRDFFLHPNRDNAPAEDAFLGGPGSYSVAPEMQSRVGDYLHDLRGRLLNELLPMVSGLPELQRLYCRSQFLRQNVYRMVEHGDSQCVAHVLEQIEEVTNRLKELSEEVAAWSPSPAQVEKATILASYLNEVSPSTPEQTQTDLTPRQTPMSTETLSRLIAGLAPGSYGRGRHASHIRKNIGGIRRVIVSAGVLANEQVRVRGRYTLEEFTDLTSTMSKTDFEKFVYENVFAERLQHANEYVSLGRVNAALLYQPLRLYRDLTQATPSLARSALSELTEQAALHAVAVHRNSVFHVCEMRHDPFQADLATARPDLIEAVSGLHSELGAFFGHAAEDLPDAGWDVSPYCPPPHRRPTPVRRSHRSVGAEPGPPVDLSRAD